MNTKNALGFLFVGVLMRSLPSFEPHWFTHLGPDGTYPSAAWVACMGLVLVALGGGYLIKHHAWPSLLKVATYRGNRSPGRELALERSN